VRGTIESTVSTVWAGATVVQWGDRPFTPPDGPWLRVTVRFGDAYPETLDNVNRLVGVLLLDLFARQNAGLGAIVGHADTLRTGLALLQSGQLRFGLSQGPREMAHAGWTQLAESIPFEWWETA
jgi:hypothetical protein